MQSERRHADCRADAPLLRRRDAALDIVGGMFGLGPPFEASARGSVLSLGVTSSLSWGVLADLMASLRPCPDIRVVEQSERRGAHLLEAGAIDLLFATRRWAGFAVEHVWSERVFAVLPERHPLAAQSAIRLQDLSNQTVALSRDQLGSALFSHVAKHLGPGEAIQVHDQATSRETLLNLVATGVGVALTPESSVGSAYPHVVYRPVQDMEPLPFYAQWRRDGLHPMLPALLAETRRIAAARP